MWQRAAALASDGGYDFAPMLRQIRPYVRGADLALCHVETPMTRAAPRGYPLFNTPPALARAIKRTGWDACSTASNHTLDRGQGGINGTINALRRHGIEHTGSAKSKKASRRITMLRTKGIKVAYLAYTTTTNGIPLPHPWSVQLAHAQRIKRDARRARRRGARVVIVNLHWGTEYQHAPDATQRSLTRKLRRTKAITAIVGQHAHVVQPIRRPGGRWVVYGEGNLLSNQTAACCPAATRDGMLVTLHLRVNGKRSRVDHVTYVPTWVRHPDYTVVPVLRALRRGSSQQAALRASLRRTVGVVGRRRHLWPTG